MSSEDVVEAPALPRGAMRLGRVYARCDPGRNWESFEERSLAEVDCTESRLHRMLREEAAARGGDVIYGADCDRNGAITCRAHVGRGAVLTGKAAPRRAATSDVRGKQGMEVVVAFSAIAERRPGAPRAEEAVSELPVLPPSHVVIGSMITACGTCTELQTRDALRIAAGRLGASDVVAVRCIPWESGFRCAGSGAVTQTRP